MRSGVETVLGSHEAGVKCVEFNSVTGSTLTGSWDKTVKVWDARQAGPVASYDQPGKVYAMCMSKEKVIVGTSERHVGIYDVRDLSKPLQTRESSLLHQTRCIRPFPDGTGMYRKGVSMLFLLLLLSVVVLVVKYVYMCVVCSKPDRSSLYQAMRSAPSKDVLPSSILIPDRKFKRRSMPSSVTARLKMEFRPSTRSTPLPFTLCEFPFISHFLLLLILLPSSFSPSSLLPPSTLYNLHSLVAVLSLIVAWCEIN